MAPQLDKYKRKTLMEKIMDEPFVPIGVLGTLGMISYGAYQYKNRGSMSTSVYIMRYRVIAQSVVVGAITVGVTYHLVKDWMAKRSDS